MCYDWQRRMTNDEIRTFYRRAARPVLPHALMKGARRIERLDLECPTCGVLAIRVRAELTDRPQHTEVLAVGYCPRCLTLIHTRRRYADLDITTQESGGGWITSAWPNAWMSLRQSIARLFSAC
jgi:hypothetical protein